MPWVLWNRSRILAISLSLKSYLKYIDWVDAISYRHVFGHIPATKIHGGGVLLKNPWIYEKRLKSFF